MNCLRGKKLSPTRLKTIFWGLLLIISNTALAQKPVLKCVKRDTLLLTYGANTCGSVTQKVIIYGARNLNGPYQIIDSVAPTVNTYFFNNNPNGDTWFFFLKDKNSSGASCYTSDTLSNQPPVINPILTLNVLDKNSVEVRWRKNPSPQVVGYVVYKKTASGLIPIATLNSSDSLRYVDTNAKPNTQSEEYQVLAVDQCGSTSLFDVNHKTILLTEQQDRCTKSVTLRWNFYSGWSQPIGKHEIWLSQNGRAAFLLATVSGKDSSYSFNKLQDRAKYSFYVRAFQGTTNISSRSNDTAFIADAIVPVDYLFVKNATVANTNAVQIFWNINATAKIDSMLVLRAESDSTGFRVIGVKKVTLPIESQYFFNDSSANTRHSNLYRVVSHDLCGVYDTSNIFSTVSVSALPSANKQSKLNWNAVYFPDGNITGYQVTRIVKGAPQDIGLPLDTTARAYVDVVGADEPNVCYRIGANFNYTLPDGTIEEATSNSNLACTEQLVNVLLPNAFTPNGNNPEFKAAILFPENIDKFELDIVDRWGGFVFSTTNYTEGWNGRRNNVDLPQGTYMYYLRLIQKNTNVIERTGVILLLR